MDPISLGVLLFMGVGAALGAHEDAKKKKATTNTTYYPSTRSEVRLKWRNCSRCNRKFCYNSDRDPTCDHCGYTP